MVSTIDSPERVSTNDSSERVSTNDVATSSPAMTVVTSPNRDGNSQIGGIDVNNPSLSHPQDALGSEPQQPYHPFFDPKSWTRGKNRNHE